MSSLGSYDVYMPMCKGQNKALIGEGSFLYLSGTELQFSNEK